MSDNPEDLTPAVERYHALIGQQRFEEAVALFEDRLEDALLYRPGAGHRGVELLERLFPDGLDALPRLSEPTKQSYALHSLAVGYHFSGRPGSAVALFHATAGVNLRAGDKKGCCDGLCNRSLVLRLSGGLRWSESSARGALILARERGDRYREAVSLQWIGLALAVRGEAERAAAALRRSLELWIAESNLQGEGLLNAYLAELALLTGDVTGARQPAERAARLAADLDLEAYVVQAARLLGTAALLAGDLAGAGEHLGHALRRLRACPRVDEELPALIALAELERRRGDAGRARELLDEVWESAEHGPYPLFHADANIVHARLERDAGDPAGAIAAATRAYELAWCDGPPFGYHWGLVKARRCLAELRAPEPDLEPFDESRFEAMPSPPWPPLPPSPHTLPGEGEDR